MSRIFFMLPVASSEFLSYVTVNLYPILSVPGCRYFPFTVTSTAGILNEYTETPLSIPSSLTEIAFPETVS